MAIQTDIIVGFPGETEAQFENTLKLLAEIEFDVVHVAAYSPRPGTPAAEYPGQLPLEEKKRRLHRVEELQRRIASEKNARYLGRRVEVLVEGQAKGKWYGRTRTNKIVHVASDLDLGGKLIEAEIVQTSPWSLQGTLVAIEAPRAQPEPLPVLA